MAKLTEYQNPLSGKKASLFNIGELWSMIAGVFVLLAAFGAGTWLWNKAKGMVPGPIGQAIGSNSILSPRPGQPTVVSNQGPAVTFY